MWLKLTVCSERSAKDTRVELINMNKWWRIGPSFVSSGCVLEDDEGDTLNVLESFGQITQWLDAEVANTFSGPQPSDDSEDNRIDADAARVEAAKLPDSGWSSGAADLGGKPGEITAVWINEAASIDQAVIDRVRETTLLLNKQTDQLSSETQSPWASWPKG